MGKSYRDKLGRLIIEIGHGHLTKEERFDDDLLRRLDATIASQAGGNTSCQRETLSSSEGGKSLRGGDEYYNCPI